MSDKKRVMWLLNHTSARKFEVPMLKDSGFDEVFLPKSFPADPDFRSSSVDWSEDQYLTIPKEDLDVLNKTDWYSGGDVHAWTIANKWFDAVFFIIYNVNDARLIKNIANYFNGICLWRVFGLDKTSTYDGVIKLVTGGKRAEYFRKMGKRFVFAMAYDHLANIEPSYLSDRAVYFPLGMKNTMVNDAWTGKEKRILFVCPDIAISPYYNKVYKDFVNDFSDFEYIIGGTQPIKVMDKNVLGFVTDEMHNHNMCDSAAMFYHSREPYHVHYHPFEAIRNGLPLIFMSGGLLDKLGGENLPGRCETISEAKAKLRSIINNDQKFIQRVRDSQPVLLNAMNYDSLKPYWLKAIPKVLSLCNRLNTVVENDYSQKKIAVILPVGYLGGSLRGAILLANAIKAGSEESADNCQVVFYHLDSDVYNSAMLADLDESISRRPYKWERIKPRQSERLMAYAGYEDWNAKHTEYIIPNDGINHAFDCDLWLIVSDRVDSPLLPVRPAVFMVYDYLQRRQDLLNQKVKWAFLDAARKADKVLVTTEFTYQDALNYAGIPRERLSKLPMLIPDFTQRTPGSHDATSYLVEVSDKLQKEEYFIWPTNTAPHKNIPQVLEALNIYYEVYNGKFNCLITGANTESILHSRQKHLAQAVKVYSTSTSLKRKVVFKGNVSDLEYKSLLQASSFLLHSAHGDNGTFSVVEAAFYSIPSLSNSYPAIHEMNENYNLNIHFYNVFEPHDLAAKLKFMEIKHNELKSGLPNAELLKQHTSNNHAKAYWTELKGLL